MTLVAFHFKKMLAEKKKNAAGKISAKNNVAITDIKEAKLNMGKSSQAGAEVTFQFTVNYEPDLGSIELVGAVVYMGTTEVIKAVMDAWEKDKQVSKDVVEELYNHVLHKCNIQALIMARDMQLPAHIQLPRVKAKE